MARTRFLGSRPLWKDQNTVKLLCRTTTPLTNIPTTYKHPNPYSTCHTAAKDISLLTAYLKVFQSTRLTDQPNTMGENNTQKLFQAVLWLILLLK